MHYTHNNDIRPSSLQAEHQSTHLLDVNNLWQKLDASTSGPAYGYIAYTLQLRRLQSYTFIITMMLSVLHQSIIGENSIT